MVSWRRLVDDEAKLYTKKYGTMFSVEDKKQVAVELADYYDEQIQGR